MRYLLFLLAIADTLWGFRIEQAFNIRTIKVESRDDAPYREYYGRLSAERARTHDLSLRFGGYITRLYADRDYMRIAKGDKLFDIYSKEVYNLYDELRIAQKSSPALYESIRNKIALFGIDAPERNSDGSVTIRSSVDGIITANDLREGSFVMAGKRALEITDLSSLWLIANVYQKDRGFVREGMRATAEIDGVSGRIDSKVDALYPALNPADQTIPVRIVLPNPELRLYPGMFARVHIYEKSQKHLIVPHNAVVTREGKHYLFSKEGNEYTPIEVEAVRTPEGYEISSGAEEGDEIVANALFLLDSDAVTNGLYNDEW